jgi:hypothetical protein
VVTLGNESFELAFDDARGGLVGIANRLTGQQCLAASEAKEPGSLFAVYSDFREEYEIRSTHPGHTPYVGTEPESISGRVFSPAGAVSAVARRRHERGDEILTMSSHDPLGPWEVELEGRCAPGASMSSWRMRLTNRGSRPEPYLAVFPVLRGLDLGADAMMVANDQGGYICPLWSHGGGIYGNGVYMSMQWGCMWSPGAGGALGFVVRDGELKNKEIRYRKPAVEVRYFPPAVLEPGASVDLPEVELWVFQGDWRPVARRYGGWLRENMGAPDHPALVHDLDSYMGSWVEKRGNVYHERSEGVLSISTTMDSLEELPRAFLRAPLDLLEIAFFCRQSMLEIDWNGRRRRVHTDGANIVREDLGGAEALRRGVEGVHRLGLRIALYVEGFIVPEDSELAPQAGEWVVQHRDGTRSGNYSGEGFLHMCPGCEEWQEHLAESCARLLRDTGADGVRLDSLGHYFFACYNPGHRHPSPFGYREWVTALMRRVRGAMRAVNPDAFLATEGPVDYFSGCSDIAYSSQGRAPDYDVSVADVSPMRVVLPDYRLFMIGGGPVVTSLSGYPGGNVSALPGLDLFEMDESWRAARYTASVALRDGDASLPRPLASRPDVTCRLWRSGETDVVVGARPSVLVEPDTYVRLREQSPFAAGGYRNSAVNIKRGRASVQVRWPADRAPSSVLACDVEHLSVAEAAWSREGGVITVELTSNWFVVLASFGEPVPAAVIDTPERARPGQTVELGLRLVGRGAKGRLRGRVAAPGLCVGTREKPVETDVPGKLAVAIPLDARPGKYWVWLDGDAFHPCKRMVEVRE